MMPFLDTARDLARLADPDCSVCKGAGFFLRWDKAPISCDCTELDEKVPKEDTNKN